VQHTRWHSCSSTNEGRMEQQQVTVPIALGPGHDSPVVYRYFDQEQFADVLCERGVLRLSSLERCRVIEDAKRRDVGEATHLHHLAEERVDSAAKQARLAAFGFGAQPGDVFENCVVFRRIPDALLVCTATRFSAALQTKFGKFCVEISRPALALEYLVQGTMPNIPVKQAGCALVRYGERTSSGVFAQYPIGFMKPVIFEDEEEFRFMLVPKSLPLPPHPHDIAHPGLPTLCRRVA